MNGELDEMEHQFLRTNGVTLHTVLAGPVNGTPVVLLHGFPGILVWLEASNPGSGRGGLSSDRA